MADPLTRSKFAGGAHMPAAVACRLAGVLVLLCAFGAVSATPVGAIPYWDPSAAVAAYSAALNAHDLQAAVALFDEHGSATDLHGRHYEGSASLTEFLLANGFGQADARIQTERLHVVGNRAVWTYSCSCAAGTTEVRLVTNQNKITVFAMMPTPAAPIRKPEPASLPLLFVAGLIVLGATGFVGAGAWRALARRAAPRAAQGRLLTALARAHTHAAFDRRSATGAYKPASEE